MGSIAKLAIKPNYGQWQGRKGIAAVAVAPTAALDSVTVSGKHTTGATGGER